MLACCAWLWRAASIMRGNGLTAMHSRPIGGSGQQQTIVEFKLDSKLAGMRNAGR
jgi:hypothetical protein